MCYLREFKRSRSAMECQFETSTASMIPRRSLPQEMAPKKRVSIEPTVTVHTIDQKSSTMAEDVKSSLYYSQVDLEHFNQQVRQIRQELIKMSPNKKSCPFDTAQACLESHGSIRGLERHICQERVRNKIIANRTVLKYQEHFASCGFSRDELAENIAAISSKLSEWSNLIALETARLDTLSAYGDNVPENACSQPIELIAFPVQRRRVTIEESCQPPNKRQKL